VKQVCRYHADLSYSATQTLPVGLAVDVDARKRAASPVCSPVCS